MEEPRVIVRWDGQEHKGFVQIGDVTIKLTKRPSAFRRFVDLWYVPDAPQLEVRERPCDPKREMTSDEHQHTDQFVRVIGSLLRPLRDILG